MLKLDHVISNTIKVSINGCIVEMTKEQLDNYLNTSKKTPKVEEPKAPKGKVKNKKDSE